MAEHSYFFNSTPEDKRWYLAQDFANYFADVLSSGILPPTEGEDVGFDYQLPVHRPMSMRVLGGKALIKGHRYVNEVLIGVGHELTFEPHTALWSTHRIDRVVLRLDHRNSARNIRLAIKQGTTEPPSLQRDHEVYELSLYQVRINAGVSAIDHQDITDERADETVCGFANSLITVPTSVFQQQFDSWFSAYKQTHQTDAENWLDDLKAQISQDTEIFVQQEILENSDTIAGQLMQKADEAVYKATNAADVANGIDGKATEALSKSNTAKDTAEYVQSQLDNVTADGDSLAEVVQARADFVNLRDRLDTEFGQVTEQLDQNQQQIIRQNEQNEQNEQLIKLSSSVLRYGKIDLTKIHSGFNIALPFDLYRDKDKVIKHSSNPQQFTTVSSKVYISRQYGLDTKSGLTADLAIRTLTRALEIANEMSAASVDIVFLDKLNSYLFSNPSVNEQTFTLSKNIRLCSNNEEGTFLGTWSDSYAFAWTSVTGAIYSTTRSAVQRVLDYNNKDFRGLPRELKKVNSQNEMVAGTWCADGSTVYVRTFDNRIPDAQIAMLLPIDASVTFNLNGYRLVVDNVHFWFHQNTLAASALTLIGNQSSIAYLFNSSFRFSRFNGLSHKDIGQIYSFDCYASDNGYDGFNYHGSGDEFAFEYNCYSHLNGAIIRGTGNATTAHDGMTMLRIGSIGHDCYGPLLADVQGCLSINFDCVMYDSLRAAGNTKSAFWTDGNGGKMYLINCQGGGKDTWLVNSDGVAQIYADRLSGGDIPQNVVINQ